MSALVQEHMTRHIVAVSPRASIATAEKVLSLHRCRHLIVLERGELVGVTCICDLRKAPPGGRVVERLHPLVTVQASATMIGAAAVMRSQRVGCLPVVSSGLLLGILTRGDLVRAGMEPELSGRATCASCGFAHNLAEDSRTPGVTFCQFCRERASPDGAHEIGGEG